jgi:hypothetical protein
MATPLQNFRAPTVLWDAAIKTLGNVDERSPVIVNIEPGMSLSAALRAFLQAVTEIP